MNKISRSLAYTIILISFSIIVMLFNEDNLVLERTITQQAFIGIVEFDENEEQNSRKLAVDKFIKFFFSH